MVKKVNLLPEKCGYLAKNWFIWFKPACTAQSANPSSKTWFKRPDEQYIHDTTYYRFYQKQRFHERKPKNGCLKIDKMDKSQYTEKFP